MDQRISPAMVAATCLLIVCLSCVQPAAADSTSATSSELVVGPREESAGWLVRVLRELFDDIDWAAIEKAREQVEKFVRKVDRLIRTFRAGAGQQEPASRGQDVSLTAAAAAAAGTSKEARLNSQAKWWSSGPKLAGAGALPADVAGPLAAELSGASDVKAMLERVACFLGYMRILADSNQALAELDAAKLVSSLFSGPASAASSKSGGFFKRWFG